MIVAKVIRSEGFASALRRAQERIGEGAEHLREMVTPLPRASILNVAANPTSARFGGVGIQLMARLRVERTLRDVALVDLPRLREGLAVTGAKAIHIEGTSGLRVDEILRLIDEGIAVIVSMHDFSLKNRELLRRAKGVIFPSRFLANEYDGGEVIEPSSGGQAPTPVLHGKNVAFAGALHHHKGAHLLPDIARAVETLHIFGGAGDHDLVRAVRKITNVAFHGYYRAGTLPSLLARYRIGVVVIPSIVPEAFSLVISEAWLAGASVVAFDLGAQAERIRDHGGGLIAPLASGAAGLAERIAPAMELRIPAVIATATDAARAHCDLYRRWRLL